MPESFDVLIVGGGSAGSVLANRLSEDPSIRVLVLEAGRPDYPWDVFIHMPAALAFPIGSRFYDWRFQSEPEPELGGRRIYHCRGKLLGGSGTINGMIFQRGNPADYDRWAADPGMTGWDYASCLPYFSRMEDCVAALQDDPLRGKGGPIRLERGPAASPLFQAFFAAVQEAGYSLTSDLNGQRQEGFGPFDRTIDRGRRVSPSSAYLRPAKRRPNLTVRTRALVHRVLFEGTRAVGVEYRQYGRLHRVLAGETILCGGAFNSPQLLHLSGVGRACELEALGVGVVADLPGVGENLQDHLEVYIQHGCRQPVSMQPYLKWRYRPWVGAAWLFGRTGPGATNHFEAGGFVRGDEGAPYPDVMLHFLPIAIRYDGSSPAQGHGYQVHIGPMLSTAKGTVKIRSANPAEHPAIRFNYLSAPDDRAQWLKTVHIARRILSQPALAPYDAGEISPGPKVATDEQILDWVARDAETALHPCGTCRMGTGPDAVVDPATMRVHGLDGLRVVDASVFPYVTNANIYAPTLMVAEKAADLIRGLEPLPASGRAKDVDVGAATS